MGKARRKTNQPDMFGQGANDDQIEWQAIREARKAHHVNAITIILILSIITSVLGMMVSLKSSGNVTSIVSQIQTILDTRHDDTPGRDVALENVNTWLAGDSTPVPNGFSNLSWVSCSKLRDTDGGQLWTHRFDFTDKRTGRTRTVSQLVLVKGNASSALGVPTMFPLPAKGQANSGSDGSGAPGGYKDVSDTGSLENVVKQWAKAYAGSDSTALTVSIGDPKASHAYQAADLGRFASADVNWAVWCTREGRQAEAGSGYAAASVTITFTPKYDKPDTGAASDSSDRTVSNASTRLTLLVSKPTSGAAKVVDWGADGSVKTLRPYSQAVSKSSISDDSDSTDSDSDSGTDSDSGSDTGTDGDDGADSDTGSALTDGVDY